MKATFFKITLLIDMFGDDATSWKANVTNTGVAEGYGLGVPGDDGEEIADFACDEMEFADVDVYDFMGDRVDVERFYTRDIQVFKHKEMGTYWVLDCEDLMQF